jgi:rod shape-determining protein MreC
LRNVFSSKAFAVVGIVLICCVGSAIYTATHDNAQTPFTRAIGVIVSPAQKAVTAVANRIAGAHDYLFEYKTLKKENEELKQQVSDMEQKVRDADLALEENNRLRDLLDIKERNRSFTFEIAEVTGRNVGNWSTTLTIDKGSSADVAVNDCVITADGMVGYVTAVGPTYAEVTTVLDPDMQAAALVTRSRAVAVAEGDFGLMRQETLKLSYLTKDADVVIGDTIETSGSGGVFPKGLMIGTVEQIITEENGITNYAVIKPFVDIANVKSVFIIKSFEVTD